MKLNKISIFKSLIVFQCTVSFLLLIQPAFAKKSAKYKFKLATLAPDRSIWMKTYNSIAKEILNETNGDVKFKCYPGGIQGDELTVIRKMRIGQLQGAGVTGNGLSKLCEDSLVMQLPNIFKDYQEFDSVFEKVKPHLENQCRSNGYEVLGWPHLGFIYLFSKDLVNDVSSLRTSKPWLFEDDKIGKELYKTAGVSAVSAQLSDVLTGLRSGLIRTVFAPPVGMLSLQWSNQVKYHLDLKGMYTFGTFIVKKKNWDKLPAPYQRKIKSICRKHFGQLTEKVRKQNNEALNVIKKQGVRTVQLTLVGKEEFDDFTRETADNLAKNSFSHTVYNLMNKALADYRNGE